MRVIFKTFSLIFCLSLSFCFFSTCKRQEEVSSYNLSVRYDEGIIDGKLRYKFVNSYKTTFEHLVFNLHANAYKEGACHAPVTESTKARAYPNGLSYGHVSVNKVRLAEQSVNYEVYGDDCQFLKIYTGEIKDGKTVEVEIDFQTVLPESTLRLGKTSLGVNLGDFFPTACKIENGAFKEITYSSLGDPYASNPHDYNVNVTVPSEYTVASSGFPTLTEVEGAYTTYSYELFKGRDFALALSKNYKVFSKTHNGIVFTYYGFSDDGEDALNRVIDSAEFYSNSFGDYPYKSLSVAECDFIFGGMEYSGLCFVNSSLSKEDKMQVISHEVAHEWWRCGVESDQISSAYIDEGLAEYSTYLFTLKNVSNQDAEKLITSAKLGYKSFFSIEETLTGNVNTAMERELSSFKNEFEYANLAYNKSLIMFYEYGKVIGEDKAIKNLSRLYSNNVFGDVTLQKLIDTLGHKEHFLSFVEGKVLI